MKFVLFKKSLEEGAAPIYLFDGEEEYFKERGEEMLKERYLREPVLDFASFRGEQLKGAELSALVAAAQAYPLLSEKRIVKVTGLYPSEHDYNAYLRAYFEDPQPSSVLLIVNGGKGKGFDLKKAPNVTHVDCSKADEETVLRWIFTRFRRAGVSCDTECCDRILRYCLGDMARVAGETEKLIAFAGEGGAVRAEDVDAVVYRDADYKIYEMTDAIGKGNAARYMTILGELSEKGMNETDVLNSLTYYFRNLFDISLLNKTDAETAKILGMKEYAVKMSRRQAQALGKRRVAALYMRAVDALDGIRSGRLTPQGALLSVNAQVLFGAEGA